MFLNNDTGYFNTQLKKFCYCWDICEDFEEQSLKWYDGSDKNVSIDKLDEIAHICWSLISLKEATDVLQINKSKFWYKNERNSKEPYELKWIKECSSFKRFK